eukprot:m.126183 g.126183  ORF g.126183 m.126183 type:complete len:869 (-) comp12989_c1_seq1:243-2849(-)
MGTGASKNGNANISTRKAVSKSRRKGGLEGADESDAFHNVCYNVFFHADLDKNGVLDHNEFVRILNSDTLSLNLSTEEVERIWGLADADGDGAISYREFLPAFKHMLRELYEDHDEDWNDWGVMIDPTTNEKYYVNKRTSEMQTRRPENYHEERVEIQNFEYYTLEDGTEVSTYVDEEGNRWYMDWESQDWCPFDESMLRRESVYEMDDENPGMGTFNHPTKGVVDMFMQMEERAVIYYYDSDTGQWMSMPHEWECQLQWVKENMEEFSAMCPQVTSIHDQLLLLHDSNYDVNTAVNLAEINNMGKGQNNESLDVAQRVFELEKELAEKNNEINKLKEDRIESETSAKRQFVREKTRVEDAAQRKERLAQEAQERIEELQEMVVSLREQVSGLEGRLVAHQADAERIQQLEAELASTGGKESSAVSELTQELERKRMENVALKLKVQRFKDKQSQSADTHLLVEDMQRKIRSLRREKEEMSAELQTNVEMIGNMFDRALQYSKALNSSVTTQVQEIRAKYLKEQVLRKLLYNKVQELRGNIRVFCRVRRDNRSKCVIQFPSDTEMIVPRLQGGEETVDFEKCYSPNSTQEEVFADTKPLILSSIDGYNVCIMAYGQTGSGKTYTMMGPDDNPGVNKRAIQELLDTCNAKQEVDFTISVSLLEVYNEKIFDLLSGDRSKSLKIHNGPNGIYVGDLLTEEITTQQDVLELMQRGDNNRSVAATQMNTDSSRSHLVLQINIKGFNKISRATSHGKLTLVDLAGSERVSKTEASGERLVEAAAINKSLSALGQVFKALASNSPHIPYRNSKLTHVLQDSLGGDSKTAVFVNVSPLDSNKSETLMTIKFGQNIRKVELGPARKHNKRGPPKRK